VGPPHDYQHNSYYVAGSHYPKLHHSVTLAAMKSAKPPAIASPSPCPVARTLDIVGDSWTILILRDLMTSGPRRFQDFGHSLQGISPTTLSSRLKRLEEAGIVERRFYEQHPPRAEYLLTDRGNDLRPVLKGLLQWGQRHTMHEPRERNSR
jgi:DNA-binding HxlR family transcriptional regulator